MAGSVLVEYGVNSREFFLAGKTVREAVDVARATWVLPENVDARLNGESTSMTTVLEDGDELQLIKPAGDKGL